FTGCARGLFGTYARDHVIPTDNDDERGIAVEEFIYLEGPGPQLAYALLTGLVLGTNNTLPDNWHLGTLRGTPSNGGRGFLGSCRGGNGRGSLIELTRG
ncbi:hypothetical protein, partial [uncultured Microbulbifer sp.]|uniref:hypothetical protein n=1 Tax=uncultured Microbulbifer sp. TaxID=348147 RepID=UPI002624E867